MANAQRHRINSPGVIHQMMDGEAVVINLDTGHYYSLTGAAASIWARLDAGWVTSEIAAQLPKDFEGTPANCPELVERFVHELRTENLIVPATTSQIPSLETPDSSEKKGKFSPPELKKFTDMSELLLLDPVHEVGEGGWPHPPA